GGEKGPAPMKIGRAPRTFQELIFTLQRYWSDEGCVILEPYDMEVGAGTFHTATFLRAVGPEPWRAAYVQPSRRPTDGRYGEITYGLERLAMYLQGVESIYDILWSETEAGRITYGDVFHQNEVEQSAYNFEHADVPRLLAHFEDHERMCQALLAARLPLPAYEQVLKASHTFNLLDARRAISVTERQRYLLRVRTLASAVARAYLESREALGFPLLKAATPARAAAAGGAPGAAA